MNDANCPNCFVGRLTEQPMLFTDIVYDSLLAVPDVPAHLCDVCGYIEYHEGALVALFNLLGIDADFDSNVIGLRQSAPHSVGRKANS